MSEMDGGFVVKGDERLIQTLELVLGVTGEEPTLSPSCSVHERNSPKRCTLNVNDSPWQ